MKTFSELLVTKAETFSVWGFQLDVALDSWTFVVVVVVLDLGTPLG